MNELPSGWIETKVGDISAGINYGFTAKSSGILSGPKYLRITDIQGNAVDWETVPHCEFPAKRESDYSLRVGDIVFARTGATTGKSFLIEYCPEAVFASYLIRIRSTSCVLPKFMAFFFQTSSYWNQISENISGSAQPNCNASKLAKISIPIAPLAEQRRIVANLEPLLAKVDTSRKRLERIPTILKRFRQAVLAAACEGRLTEDWRDSAGVELDVSQSWTQHRMDELFLVRTGGTPSRKESRYYDGGSIPWIKTGEVQNGLIGSASEHITQTAVEDSNAKIFPTGTILIALYGDGKTRGQVGRLTFPAATNQACAALISNKLPEVTFQYVFNFWLSQYQRLRDESAGGNQQNLNLGIIKQWEIALPPLHEQHEIVRRVSQLFTLADQIEARYINAKTHVDRLTQSILAKAFRGELVPQDPNDEPAEMLLARLKAQPADTASPKRRGRPKKAGG